ncbi:MAG TPA: hypothetical protein VJ227_04190 [Patescibacteria group bacterium]|nr:hypothetical protein [Patescibacteria group bacterium]
MSPRPLLKYRIPLQDWANAFEPGDEMLWKRGYWEQIVFVRDEIHRLFVATYEESKRNPVMVVSMHTSKSIRLPVYNIKVPGIEIWMRYNFFDWKVSIRSERPVPDVFHNIIRKDVKIHEVYFEGFSKDWIFGSYDENPCQFSVEVRTDYDLYAFLLVIADALRQK